MSTPLRELPPRLQDRYGYRPVSRWLIGVGVAACLALLAFGVYAAVSIGSPEVYYKFLAWQSPDASHTDITFEVRRDPQTAVECALRVQSRDHVDLGYAVIDIPPGTEYEQITYQVATTEKGYAAEVLACAPAGELSATPANFPPGQPNPPQPWRPTQ